MAKHNGITIRIGAAYDEVRVARKTPDSRGNPMPDIVFDRCQMRKDGKKELQGALRRNVVDHWAQENERRAGAKGKRSQRRVNNSRDKAKREYA